MLYVIALSVLVIAGVGSASLDRGDSGVQLAPRVLTVVAVKPTAVALAWNRPITTARVGYYAIEVNKTRRVLTSATSNTIHSLSCGVTYSFAVSAVYKTGGQSPKAQLIASTTPCPSSKSGRHLLGRELDASRQRPQRPRRHTTTTTTTTDARTPQLSRKRRPEAPQVAVRPQVVAARVARVVARERRSEIPRLEPRAHPGRPARGRRRRRRQRRRQRRQRQRQQLVPVRPGRPVRARSARTS